MDKIKGRDLFDIWVALTKNNVNCQKLVDIFQAYSRYNKESVSRALFEKNLHEKSLHSDFQSDIRARLTDEVAYDFHEALQLVYTKLISLLPGEPWNVGRKQS